MGFLFIYVWNIRQLRIPRSGSLSCFCIVVQSANNPRSGQHWCRSWIYTFGGTSSRICTACRGIILPVKLKRLKESPNQYVLFNPYQIMYPWFTGIVTSLKTIQVSEIANEAQSPRHHPSEYCVRNPCMQLRHALTHSLHWWWDLHQAKAFQTVINYSLLKLGILTGSIKSIEWIPKRHRSSLGRRSLHG